MSKPSWTFLSAIRLLSSFLFVGLLIFGTLLASKYPTISLALSIFLVVVGLPLFIYGVKTGEHYKNVFDYETTQFLGKAKNGSQVRDVLMTANVVGLWCILSGLALFIITRI